MDNKTSAPTEMIEIIANDRIGKKVRIKCLPTDTIAIVKLLISAHSGTNAKKIKLQKGGQVLSDFISLEDYEIKHGSSLEMYYN
jgi:ubiquitin-like protein 5